MPPADAGWQPGRSLPGAYRLERPLTPRAEVWLGRDQRGLPLVLKTGEPVWLEREYRIVSALVHPGIVSVVDYVDRDDVRFIVFEYLPGGDLVSLAGAAPTHWLDAVIALIDTLDLIHSNGLAYRDLKARHLRFDDAGRSRLIDFGSAAAIGSGWQAGGTTPGLVAADRGTGPVSPADDVYAFAALLHELLHGAPPGHLRRALYDETARHDGRAMHDERVTTLANLVDHCLASARHAAGIGLAGFRSVIESLRADIRRPA